MRSVLLIEIGQSRVHDINTDDVSFNCIVYI